MSDWDKWLTQDPDAFVDDEMGADDPDPDVDPYEGIDDEPDAAVDEYDR